MLKNIFFDFGRTIVEHPEDGIGTKIVMNTGLINPSDAELVRNEIFSAVKYMNELDAGNITYDEYKEMVVAAVPENLRKYAGQAVMYDIYELPLINGMEDLIKDLKSEGFRCYITSNLNLRHAEQMRTHKIAKYFDGMVFSAEIRARKPFREFFETTLSKFDLKPSETLFVDDLAENVEGAEKCGIKGFVFKGDANELRNYISKLRLEEK